jgi:predicted metalloprotease with PDZ domain
MVGELLWVYEGMTRYLGDMLLSARSGFRTPEQHRDHIAYIAATLDRNRPGRNWRPLVDTAVAVQSLAGAPSEDVPYRRALDYYDESGLVWLDVDTTIRQKSGGTKTFDDFAKLFFGAPDTQPTVKPYTIDDIAGALNRVVANDWRTFLEQRVYRVNAHPPLAALEASGWRLVYDERPNWYVGVREASSKTNDFSFPLGFWIKGDGSITDVVHGSPAFDAGMRPGMKVTSVNGRAFTDDTLREELHAKKPLELAATFGTSAVTLHVENRDGDRWPHLERIEGKADLLSDIIRPHR